MLIGITAWLGRLAAASHEGAVANARAAATEASRRRVEHAEVALYLADLADRPGIGAGAGQRATAEADVAASTAAEHLA
ncbi:hypothetical protein GCM10023340_34020 [Nocardioides marinquilinus]|uniref:Uncharacterized protein n=1 Tax=Nocardioides marinquilinus TaxID=1210400 RepID=A0ABP9Q0I4_9ACTN